MRPGRWWKLVWAVPVLLGIYLFMAPVLITERRFECRGHFCSASFLARNLTPFRICREIRLQPFVRKRNGILHEEPIPGATSFPLRLGPHERRKVATNLVGAYPVDLVIVRSGWCWD